jgi:hypothetical protein
MIAEVEVVMQRRLVFFGERALSQETFYVVVATQMEVNYYRQDLFVWLAARVAI